MRKYILAVLIFFISATPVGATFSLKIDNYSPNSVTKIEDEVAVTASISGLPSESYFRVAWQKSSGDNYFGYIKNNLDEWVRIISSQDCKNYYKVSDLSTTSFILKTKIGEDNVLDNGDYLIKLRRYTSSCASYSDSDPVSVNVSIPTPTPVVTSSPSPTITPTEKPKTPTPQPTRIQTSKPVYTLIPEVTFQSISTTQPQFSNSPDTDNKVLGLSTNELTHGSDRGNFLKVPIILVGSGIVFITIAILQFIRATKKNS